MTEPTTHVGNATVTRVPETTIHFPATKLLPRWQGAPDDTIALSVHSWLVRHGDVLALIDTGIGNGKTRAAPMFDRLQTDWLDRLAQAGARPEDITHVLITHLHVDHVGWNTCWRDGSWVPTFPNARHLIPQLSVSQFDGKDGPAHRNYPLFQDSVAPVMDAGLVDLVPAAGGMVLDGFTFHPTPGHCADHMSIAFRSADADALFPGDVMHHTLQVTHPDWCSSFCTDPALAEASRRWALQYATDSGALCFSSHADAPSIGRVQREGQGYRWVGA